MVGRPCWSIDRHGHWSANQPTKMMGSIDPSIFIPRSSKNYTGSFKYPKYNFELGWDPKGRVVVLGIPKGSSSYNFPIKLDQLLHSYTHIDDYIYRTPRPKEELSVSNPREIAIYKNCFDGGLRFLLHPVFVSIFYEFHLNPRQTYPNAWRKAIYFLYLCFVKKLRPPSTY